MAAKGRWAAIHPLLVLISLSYLIFLYNISSKADDEPLVHSDAPPSVDKRAIDGAGVRSVHGAVRFSESETQK